MRLIDADELINMVEDTYSGYMLDESACPCDFIKLIDDLPTAKVGIPKNATNGEVMKIIFPNIETELSDVLSSARLGVYCKQAYTWWNALYKAESEIHCNCTDTEIAKSFIEDVEAVKDLLPQTESEE